MIEFNLETLIASYLKSIAATATDNCLAATDIIPAHSGDRREGMSDELRVAVDASPGSTYPGVGMPAVLMLRTDIHDHHIERHAAASQWLREQFDPDNVSALKTATTTHATAHGLAGRLNGVSITDSATGSAPTEGGAPRFGTDIALLIDGYRA